MQLLASLADYDAVRSIADPLGYLTLSSYPSDPNHYRRAALQLAEGIADLAE